MSERVFLIGMACSGKTTVGKKLADKLGWNFFDTDEYIREKYDADFRKLIKQKKFNSLELEALAISHAKQPCVVATGGRTYLNSVNKRYINISGDAIFIKVSFWNLLKRFTKGEQKKRALPYFRFPIWIALPIVYFQRLGKYTDGSRMVNGNDNPEAVADDILFLVNK